MSALWGSAFPLIRFAVETMPPLALSAARAAVAALALALYLGATRQAARPDRRTLRHMAVLGTVNGWLPNVLTAAALGHVTSAQGALIQACGPLIVAALAAAVLREERLGPRQWAGTALGFGGVAAILGPLALAGGGSALGGLLMLLTAFCYGCGTVYARWARPGAEAPVILGQQVFSFLPALLLALALGPPGGFAQPAPVWAAVLALGILASAVPVTLYLRLLRTARASDAALVGYLQPVWATAAAALLLGEWPEGRVLLGGAVVLAGVWLASRRRPA